MLYYEPAMNMTALRLITGQFYFSAVLSEPCRFSDKSFAKTSAESACSIVDKAAYLTTGRSECSLHLTGFY